MSTLFLITVAWLSPMPFFTKTILNGSNEHNERLPSEAKLTERQLKALALIFGVLWPVYILFLIIAFIRIIMNPSLFDE